jgi:hypothetical protein
MPYYLNPTIDGLISADSRGDGYTISLKFAKAFPTNVANSIGYNIYMSSGVAPVFDDLFFRQTPAFIYIGSRTSIDIVDLIPGELYHFGVRAFEYNNSNFDFSTLPVVNNNQLYTFPQSLLASDMSPDDGYASLLDASEFPNIENGYARIAYELISYSSVDYDSNMLLGVQRGVDGTFAEFHGTDGYYADGYSSGYLNPNMIFWPTFQEDANTRVSECWNRFDVGHYSYTTVDGYHQKTVDLLTTSMEYSDEVNTGFPEYDFAGWHRTDPVLLLNGTCIGSYIGGYQWCADSNSSVGQQVRGLNIQDVNLQRQEVLLSTIGEPVCLIKRTWTGITCKCYLPSNENPSARCSRCFGSQFITCYHQFFDPRESDGRLMVRFDPAVDDLLPTDSGLESDFKPTSWTLAVPTIKDRDILVRFDENDNEEFRYEVLNVTRNKLLLNQTGVQKFALQRIRKTDIIYQIKVFHNTSLYPQTYQTSISSSNGIPSHSHSFILNENPITMASQLTGKSAGHNHVIFLNNKTGMMEVSVELGHTHELDFMDGVYQQNTIL